MNLRGRLERDLALWLDQPFPSGTELTVMLECEDPPWCFGR
jgi:hypothetical protein